MVATNKTFVTDVKADVADVKAEGGRHSGVEGTARAIDISKLAE
jgi:hypothetical protein